jgi:hypothetical protein
MKKKLKLMASMLLIAAFAAVAVSCSKDDDDDSNKTPPYAASAQMWTFGSQTWSDAIHIPECNKSGFPVSNTDPQCRSYTADGATWYYYNAPYVDTYAAKLCPSPWRVPTYEDFDGLIANFTAMDKINAWGFGGYASGNSMYNVNTYAYYKGTGQAWYWHGYDDTVHDVYKSTGMQVRCVR